MEKSDSKSSGLDSTTSTKSFESQTMNKPNENLIMMEEIKQKPKTSGDSMVITILGSGDFGRALALRMVQSGYTVCIGSRNPERNRALVEKVGAKLMKTEEAIDASHIIVMAVPKDFYDRQPLKLLEGKTVIDVSNRATLHRKEEVSQAEYLQSLLPKSAVIKSFNVLSAYALESGGLQGTKEVLYAGDIQSAKEEVNAMIRFLGFTPVDRGSLRNAREIEDVPVQRFPNWKNPLIISCLVFAWFFFLKFAKFNICMAGFEGKDKFDWDEFWNSLGIIPTESMNQTLACTALNMLALCYLPGCIAAYIQLFRGTKYSRFPNFLDQWLKMRKYLGLLMLFSASMHACFSVATFEFPEEEEHYPQGKSKWRGECFLACGVCAYALSVVLGITSLPSVTNVLTWKEFGFVQSKLGWLCLVFGSAHELFFSWPHLLSYHCSFFLHGSMYSIWVPGLTIALKVPLLLPCIDFQLTKIRGGWTRGVDESIKA